MCIIAISEIGTALPDAETRKIMWENNPDGAGFMYARNGRVHIRKGFMTFAEMEDAIEHLGFDPKDVQFIMHYRIGTHGGNIPQNTHPFPVTARVKPMQELKYDCELAFAHNGIINSVEMIKKSISDTMEYGRQILADLLRLDVEFYKRPSIQMLIEESINGSRMVFLNGKGEIVKLGSWVEGEDGCLYSNTTYKDWRKKYKPTTYSSYSSWGGYGGYGSYSDGYGDYKFMGSHNSKPEVVTDDDYDDDGEIIEIMLCYIPDDVLIYDASSGEMHGSDDSAEYVADEDGNIYQWSKYLGVYTPKPDLIAYTREMTKTWRPSELDDFVPMDVYLPFDYFDDEPVDVTANTNSKQ